MSAFDASVFSFVSLLSSREKEGMGRRERTSGCRGPSGPTRKEAPSKDIS